MAKNKHWLKGSKVRFKSFLLFDSIVKQSHKSFNIRCKNISNQLPVFLRNRITKIYTNETKKELNNSKIVEKAATRKKGNSRCLDSGRTNKFKNCILNAFEMTVEC